MADDDKSKKFTAEDALRALRPEHCVVGDKLVRRVVHLNGRPRKVRPRPDADAREYARRSAEVAQQFVNEDPVVRAAAVERDRNDPEVFDQTLMQLAREAASLAFDRQKQLADGRDCAQTSTRRVEALSKMASLVAERARAGIEDRFNPHDPKVQRVVAAFFDALRECALETMPAAVAERFLATFEEMSKGWESKCNF